jgi:hypothetical protein
LCTVKRHNPASVLISTGFEPSRETGAPDMAARPAVQG